MVMDLERKLENAIRQDLAPTEFEIKAYLEGPDSFYRKNPPQRYGRRGAPEHYTNGPGYPSATNVVVPIHEASGNLTIGYSRNAAQFNLPKYVKYIPSTDKVGLYMKQSFQEQIRVPTTQEFGWAPGQMRPRHTNGLEAFLMVPYLTKRYDYGASMDDDTARRATWPIVSAHSRIHCTQLMTARTYRMLTQATTTANWAQAADADMTAAHYGTASAIAGGYLDQGTATAPYLKTFMSYVAALIDLETAGAVNAKDLWFICNPNTAARIGLSQEILAFIKGSYWAGVELERGMDPNNKFGLPGKLYGYNWLVENASYISSRKGAALTKAYIMPDQMVLAVSRPGGLIGVEGFSDFSTLIMPWYRDEMTLETREDSYNRLIDINVCEETVEIVASPPSGYLLTSATSATGP